MSALRTVVGLLSLSLLSLPAVAAEIPLNGHKFTLPDGFTIELVAGPPLTDRPITADFDEQGRLCGIVSQADIARAASPSQTGYLVQDVSKPTGHASNVH